MGMTHPWTAVLIGGCLCVAAFYSGGGLWHHSHWLLSAGVLFVVLGASAQYHQRRRLTNPFVFYGSSLTIASLVSVLLFWAIFPDSVGILAGITGGCVYLLTLAETRREYAVALFGYTVPVVVLVMRTGATTEMTAPFAEWILTLQVVGVVLSSIPSGLLLRALLPSE